MRFLIALVFLMSSTAWSSGHEEPLAPIEKPANCLKNKKTTCAVWTLSKTKTVFAGMEVLASRNALYEFKDGDIYLSQGTLWVKNSKPVKVSGRFGAVIASGKNEILVQAQEDSLVVRAGLEDLKVLPLGGTENIPLLKGFEVRLSYVDRNFGAADFTWPTVLDLASYLKALQKTTDEETVRKKAETLAVLVKEAAVIAAKEHALALGRMIASAPKNSGPKESEEEDASRDLRLRRLFRIKSDFAE